MTRGHASHEEVHLAADRTPNYISGHTVAPDPRPLVGGQGGGERLLTVSNIDPSRTRTAALCWGLACSLHLGCDSADDASTDSASATTENVATSTTDGTASDSSVTTPDGATDDGPPTAGSTAGTNSTTTVGPGPGPGPGPGSGSGSESTTDSGSTTTDATDSESTGTDTSSSGDPPDGDPNYPHASDGCAPGSLFGPDIDPTLDLCLPLCDLTAQDYESACPQPETGTAAGRCLVLGLNISGPCQAKGEACETFGHYCIEALRGGFFCGDGVACTLDCRNGETCPNGMSCDGFQCIYD